MSHSDSVSTSPDEDPSLGALVHDLSTQLPDLIRSEIRLAQAELTEKGRHAGIGIGMFSGAGLLAFFGLATVITTAILALSLAVSSWLAALIVAVALLLAASALALAGRRQVSEAAPPAPERAVEGVREDVATVKGRHQ